MNDTLSQRSSTAKRCPGPGSGTRMAHQYEPRSKPVEPAAATGGEGEGLLAAKTARAGASHVPVTEPLDSVV